ncbi:MAG: c-type cytochrome [Flavobacteriales bacterium]|nr:c-type cytochrome [Flavobacteriales bacterium]MDG2086673.1 c-type cytochrome [Flavobacteriales bacterium]
MNIIKDMIQTKYITKYFLLTILFTLSIKAFSQADGAKIYKQNCTACHVLGETKLIGPGLKGITEKRDKEWLKKWINNSSGLIASGDADAIAIFEEYNKVAMTNFYFSDDEFEALFSYLENPPVEEVAVVAQTTVISEDGIAVSTQLMIVALILLTFIFILTSVKNSLKESLGQETETVSEAIKSNILLFLSNTFNKLFVVLFVAIIILKFVYDAMMGVGVTTNYQPEQPIAFSHKIHAGDNGIDCNYCHVSARKSKHSSIPSANVCMNCHASIVEGSIAGTTELQKIYDAVGYDPDSRTYIEGYEQKPIEWVRIHNLPDLSYFNHSQHVTVGQLECQECHGAIEEMDVVKQHSELTMGWCIECHRETEVKMEGNDYYTSMHEKMKVKYAGEKITVDKIGGLECGKCHY